MSSSDKGKLKYEDEISKIKAKISKKEKEFEDYKVESAAEHEKLEGEEIFRLEEESNSTIAATERSVKLEISKEKAALKAAQAVLEQKLEKEKSALKQKTMKIRSEMAALKASVLQKEAGIKAKISLAQTNRMGMKSSYEMELSETKQKKREGEAKKKEISTENKIALEKQSKEDSKEIEKTMNKLEQIKLDGLKVEAKLQAQINAAQEEAKVLKENLDNEKEKYASYNEGVVEWKTKQAVKHKESVATEKSKYKEMEADYKEQAKSCQAEITAATKSIKVLKDKLDAEIKAIKDINITKQKRTEAKGKIGELQKEVGKKSGALANAKAEKRKLCDLGTPGADILAKCATMKTEIAGAEKDIQKIQADITKLETVFNAF